MRKEGCTDGDGIREGERARRVPNSGGGGLRLAGGCGTHECIAELVLMSDVGAANIGDGARRAILLEVSPDVVRLELRREDRRGVGSIDLRCWREVEESVILVGCGGSSPLVDVVIVCRFYLRNCGIEPRERDSGWKPLILTAKKLWIVEALKEDVDRLQILPRPPDKWHENH